MPDDMSLSETDLVEQKITAPKSRRLLVRFVLLIIIPLIAIAAAGYYWLYSER